MYTTNDKRNAIFHAVCFPAGWLRSTEPLFRHWDRLPESIRKPLQELKSEEVKDDIWHLRH